MNKNFSFPKWFNHDNIETVIFAFPDVLGRLMGKRMTTRHFIDNAVEAGMHACNYLMTVDIDMNIVDGHKIANWEKGFGDFYVKADMATLKNLPWHDKTAIVLGDMTHHDGSPVHQSPRQILKKQLDRLLQKGLKANMGSELEFFLYDETYRSAREKGYKDLTTASDYSIDYHILQPSKDEDVLKRIRNEMTAAGITVECSKGETANGQHEINLQYAPSMEMADRHIIYKTGAKDIASQQQKAISFMAKIRDDQAGNGFHIHTSILDANSDQNAFYDKTSDTGRAPLFEQFLTGLLKYSRELCYFFAPTINSYKRFQPDSWAPTSIACGIDNRTCGLRIVGHANSMRVENRMPGADANPYLAFAATIAAGLKGIEDNLQPSQMYQGNAYSDASLTRMPLSLHESADLLDTSTFAREVFSDEVIDFYVHTAKCEVQAYAQAITDWEKKRYFEQI